MHGDALKMGVDRGEQSNDFLFLSVTEHMQAPGAIFAAAPGKKNLLFQSDTNSKKAMG